MYVCERVVQREPYALEHVFDKYKSQEMFNRKERIPDQYKTQEVCKKKVWCSKSSQRSFILVCKTFMLKEGGGYCGGFEEEFRKRFTGYKFQKSEKIRIKNELLPIAWYPA